MSVRPARERAAFYAAHAAIAAAIALAALGVGLWLGGGEEAAVPPPAPPPAPIAAPPAAVVLPLDRVERLVALGSAEVCALGDEKIACSTDGGASWDAPVELPDRALAAIRLGEARLAAAVDGGIYELREGDTPSLWARPPEAIAVVDAAAGEDALWLLGHRYDDPAEEELRLPQVVETTFFRLGGDGKLERRASLEGYAGDRIRIERGGAVVSWAPFDRRAWRSEDGAERFERVDAQRFGADYGGLQVAIERRADRLPGPGRRARPASTLLVSADGASWEKALEAPGDILVDFADASTGVVVLRGEGEARITRDGGRSFDLLRADARLANAVALAHLDDRFLVATAEGLLFLLRVAP